MEGLRLSFAHVLLNCLFIIKCFLYILDKYRYQICILHTPVGDLHFHSLSTGYWKDILIFGHVKCVFFSFLDYAFQLVSSVTQSCPTLCNPMHCSTLGFPVHHPRVLPKLMPFQSVMPSNQLILCRPLLLCLQSFPASVSFK